MRQLQAAFVHAIAVAAVGIAVGPVAATNAGAPRAAATAAASAHDAGDGGGRTSTLLTTGWSFFRGDCRQRSACLSPNAPVQHLGGALPTLRITGARPRSELCPWPCVFRNV